MSRSRAAGEFTGHGKEGHHERGLLLGAWLNKTAGQWGRGERKGIRKGTCFQGRGLWQHRVDAMIPAGRKSMS